MPSRITRGHENMDTNSMKTRSVAFSGYSQASVYLPVTRVPGLIVDLCVFCHQFVQSLFKSIKYTFLFICIIYTCTHNTQI